jgi:cellulose biosynthesis protein BcsQ
VDDVRHHLGDKVYETVIPRNVRVSEAPSFGKPALLYDINCAGSQAYIELASEMLRRGSAPCRGGRPDRFAREADSYLKFLND